MTDEKAAEKTAALIQERTAALKAGRDDLVEQINDQLRRIATSAQPAAVRATRR